MIRSTPVVILVSDVIGFTLLSEEMDAGSVAQIIGRWYSNCEEAITKEGGTVDKFIDDSVLAYWTEVGPLAATPVTWCDLSPPSRKHQPTHRSNPVTFELTAMLRKCP